MMARPGRLASKARQRAGQGTTAQRSGLLLALFFRTVRGTLGRNTAQPATQNQRAPPSPIKDFLDPISTTCCRTFRLPILRSSVVRRDSSCNQRKKVNHHQWKRTNGTTIPNPPSRYQTSLPWLWPHVKKLPQLFLQNSDLQPTFQSHARQETCDTTTLVTVLYNIRGRSNIEDTAAQLRLTTYVPRCTTAHCLLASRKRLQLFNMYGAPAL